MGTVGVGRGVVPCFGTASTPGCRAVWLPRRLGPTVSGSTRRSRSRCLVVGFEVHLSVSVDVLEGRCLAGRSARPAGLIYETTLIWGVKVTVMLNVPVLLPPQLGPLPGTLALVIVTVLMLL